MLNGNSIQRGGVTLNNIGYLEELNTRISSRNIPSTNLPPCLSSRPVETKYTTFMVNTQQVPTPTPVNPLAMSTDFTVEGVFLPGDRPGPFAGFTNRVNDESYLRNQYFALQECPQAAWVPDSTSELYTYNVDANIKPGPVLQQHPELFRRHSLGYFNPNPDNRIGADLFNNSTRVQLRATHS